MNTAINRFLLAIILSTSSSISIASLDEKTPANFALPFGVEGLTDINKKAKPNLVFLIDDSSRTGQLLPGTSITKLQSYKNAVRSFMNKYKDEYRFGLAHLYDTNTPNSISQVMLVLPSDNSHNSVLSALDSMTVKSYTNAPIIKSLSQTYNAIRGNGSKLASIIYRCQQSHVFILSDGVSTGEKTEELTFHGKGVIYPEEAAFSKQVGTFKPDVLVYRRAVADANLASGNPLPNTHEKSCWGGGRLMPFDSRYNKIENRAPYLCYSSPSPDGYSTYSHFADKDTAAEMANISHLFDDPEYPVQNIYTSWISTKDSPINKDSIPLYQSELIIDPESIAIRGRGYYKKATSESTILQSLEIIAGKIKTNPAYSLGRYQEAIIAAGFGRNYSQNMSSSSNRLLNLPILNVVQYPNRWGSVVTLGLLDENGKRKKYPDSMNESFAGREIEIQTTALTKVFLYNEALVVNTDKGAKVLFDAPPNTIGGQAGENTNPMQKNDFLNSNLTNKTFGLSSTDANLWKKIWPGLLSLSDQIFMHADYNTKLNYFRRYGLRPNALTSAYMSEFSANGNQYGNGAVHTFKEVTTFRYDESYEPTNDAMDAGMIFPGSILTFGDKSALTSPDFANDLDKETETDGYSSSGSPALSVGFAYTFMKPSARRYWLTNHYFLRKSTINHDSSSVAFMMPHIIVGQNNGRVSVHSAAKGPNNPYTSKLSGRFHYIPGAIQQENGKTILQAIADTKHINFGDEDHPFKYLFNGQFAALETENYKIGTFSGYHQSIVVGTTGQGGKGVFSLNTPSWLANTSFQLPTSGWSARDTEKTNMVYPQDGQEFVKRMVNWDSAANPHTSSPMLGLEKIGYTVGRPAIARLAMDRDSNGFPVYSKNLRILSFVSNGYNGTEQQPSLYVIDAVGADFGTENSLPISNNAQGKLLKKIEMPVVGDNNGLSSPTLVDYDFDGVADLAYVGDLNGNLYRVDFRGKSIDDWEAKLLYEGDASQPITTAPQIYREDGKKMTIIFGTGSQIYKVDMQDLSEQSVYGIVDDPENDSLTSPVATFKDRGDILTEQIFTESSLNGQGIRTLSSKLSKAKGWFINLRSETKSALGERVIAEPIISGGTLFMTTYFIRESYLNGGSASDPICAVPMGYASSWQLMINAKTGGQITKHNNNLGDVQIAGVSYLDKISPYYISDLNNLPYNHYGQILGSGKLFPVGKINRPIECRGDEVVISADKDGKIQGDRIVCKQPGSTEQTFVKRLSWNIIN